MSIRLETERIKNAKASLKTIIDSKLETPIPESATLDQYPVYVEQLAAAGGGQINEQLSSQITRLRVAPSEKSTVKLQWEIPDDPNYAGADISWAREGVPTFPINEDNIISVDGTENSVTIEGLEEDVLYGFVVMAKNENGTRNTASTSSNTVLGYVSKEEVFYEVDVPTDLGTSLVFKSIPDMHLLFVSSSSSNSSYAGCYVCKNGIFTKIIQQDYNFAYIQGYPVQGLVFLSCNSSQNGIWVYDTNTEECARVFTIGYRWNTIGLTDGTILASYQGGTSIYKYNYETKNFISVSSGFRVTDYSHVAYETENYALLVLSNNGSTNYSNLVHFDKTTNAFTQLAAGNTSSSSKIYRWFIKGDDIKFVYHTSDKLLIDLANIAGGKLYVLNDSTGTIQNCIDSTTDLNFGCINNKWVCAGMLGLFVFNNDTNLFDIQVAMPEGIARFYNGKGWCIFDNTLFCVNSVVELNDSGGTTEAPGGLYKWNTDNNIIELICERTFTTIVSYSVAYPGINKLFIQGTYINADQDTDVYVYDKITKQAEVLYSGAKYRLWADKKDHAMLIKTDRDISNNFQYNASTNAFEIAPNITGYISGGTLEDKYWTEIELTNTDIIIQFSTSSYNQGLYVYKFDINGNVKQLTTEKGFTDIVISSGKEYLINNTNAYYYDEATDSLVQDGSIGGNAITLRKRLNKALNAVVVYAENNVTNYNTLQGDYSNASISTNYAYSSTSAKILVAF